MTEYVIGLMSGTSADGVDAVLAAISDDTQPSPRIRSVAHAYRPFSATFRSELLSLMQSGPDEIERGGRAAVQLARIYADAANDALAEAKLQTRDIRALGAHGQTIRHRPEQGYSVQLMNGALLAQLTGIDVVCDFRSADIAAGGQGAPLVPRFHAAVFYATHERRAVLNIGGIANVTLLLPNEPVRGWDVGPGNCLMDTWIGRNLDKPYDEGGVWGGTGIVNDALLAALLSEPYFAQMPPKSTGRELFNEQWLDALLTRFGSKVSAQDVQATLRALTAFACARALRQQGLDRILVCGGGALNGALMRELRAAFPGVTIEATDAYGVEAMQVEALAFAWFAYERVASRSELASNGGALISPCVYRASA